MRLNNKAVLNKDRLITLIKLIDSIIIIRVYIVIIKRVTLRYYSF